MSVDYVLGVATDLSPKRVLEVMYGAGKPMPEIRTLPERPRVFHLATPELELLAYQVDNAATPIQRLWVEGLGVSLRVKVVLPGADDSHASLAAMLRAIMNFMDQSQDDLALLYHTVALVRNSGELTLNRSHELWRPEFLEMITIPYEMKDIPTP